jgi:hypothetical protein
MRFASGARRPAKFPIAPVKIGLPNVDKLAVADRNLSAS